MSKLLVIEGAGTRRAGKQDLEGDGRGSLCCWSGESRTRGQRLRSRTGGSRMGEAGRLHGMRSSEQQDRGDSRQQQKRTDTCLEETE